MHYTAEHFDDYLCGELGSEHDAVIHAHIETCTDCRTIYDESVNVRDWIRTNARAEELEFPSIIKGRVWDAVRHERPSFAARLRALWRPMVAVPIAAALAVFAYVGLPLHGAHASGVAATYLLEEHAALASDNPLADRGLVVPASMVDTQRSTGLMDAGDEAGASVSDQ